MSEILLVEDSEEDAELTMRVMRKAIPRATVVRVHDGADALEYLFRRGAFTQRSGDLPALILLDLHMPRVGGFEALEIFRTSDLTKNTPIIVLTSSDVESPLWERARGAGNHGYLKKPISMQEITSAMALLGLQRLCS